MENIDNDYLKSRVIWEERLSLVLDIAEQMVVSGAEVARTEYSIRRMCRGFGAARVEAVSIATSLIVSVYYGENSAVTHTRRIERFAYNMDRLEKMNELSRNICENGLGVEEGREKFNLLMSEKGYSFYTKLIFYMIIAFSFTLFFGGSIRDAVASAAIAALFKCIDEFAKKVELNKFITIIISSLSGGFLAIVAVKMGFADSASMISIGNVMLLIPGIMLTNSLRDMFGGDTIAGGVRFIEATLIAVVIALGFSYATVFYKDIFSEVIISSTREWSPFAVAAVSLSTAFIGSICFAGVFNVSAGKLFAAGMGGFIGWASYFVLGFFMLSEPVKYFSAAIVINIYSEVMARVEKAPATVFLVVSVMPLVPGGLLYKTMGFALAKEWEKFGSTGAEMLSIALALALGMLMANSVIKSMRRRRMRKLGYPV